MSPAWFIVFFATVWLSVSALLTYLSGWMQLAKKFASTRDISGEEFRFASGSIGVSKWFPVNYRNCLNFTVGNDGFGLSMMFLFRAFSPGLFIPWPELESVQVEKLLFVTHRVISIQGYSVKIKVQGKAGEAIEKAFKGVRDL